MIDRNIFSLDKLLNALLDDVSGNVNKWRSLCFIEPDKKNPHFFVVRCKDSHLRSIGGMYIWDCYYGEDSQFYNAEYALLALQQAPVPPFLLKQECWGKPSQCGMITVGGPCALDSGHSGECRSMNSLIADSAELSKLKSGG